MNIYNDKTKISKRLVKKALSRGAFSIWGTDSWNYSAPEGAEEKFISIVKALAKKRGVEELVGERPTRWRYTWIYGNSTVMFDETFEGYNLNIWSND